MIEIKSCVTNQTLFTSTRAKTLTEAVIEAVSVGADLYEANLPRVNLSGVNLSGVNLAGVNLARANLARANLREAYLARANLREANLVRADLSGANLFEANLSGANLYGANLSRAYLIRADLFVADPSGAKLLRTCLPGANLLGADLSRADLPRANLSRANLSGANLLGVQGLAFQIPQDGELIVWKKVRGGVCKLRVPPEARRTASIIGRKCRAEWVEVLEAPKNSRSIHDFNTVYRVGEIVRSDKYDDDPRVECTHGIHFFLTREEAENY